MVTLYWYANKSFVTQFPYMYNEIKGSMKIQYTNT